MSWKCIHCGEVSEEQYEVCWHCGAGCDGRVDPDFLHADDFEPPLPNEKPQFRLGSLLAFVTASCLAFGLANVVATRELTLWNAFVGLAGLGGLTFLFLLLVTWFFTGFTSRCQREIRADAQLNRGRNRGRQCGPTGPIRLE